MYRSLLLALCVLALLPLDVVPAAAVCCQYRNGCGETSPGTCRSTGGAVGAGVCRLNECRPALPPARQLCCQLQRGCVNKLDPKRCEAAGGVPAPGQCRHIREFEYPVCRR